MTLLITMKILKNFSNKVMVLILMEALFLLIILNQAVKKSEMVPMMFLMNIMIFMVLDSTMGISILVSSSRNSSASTKEFQMI